MNININKSKVAQAVLCCLLWSTAIPILKISYVELNLSSDDVYNRITLAGLRFLISGVFLLAFFLLSKKQAPKIKKKMILPVVVFGCVNTALQYMFFYTGVMNTAAIQSVLLDSLKPLLVVVLAHFFSQGDRINLKKVIGLFAGFLGIFVANASEFTSGEFVFTVSFAGEGMLFLASLAYAIAVIYGKKIMKRVHYLPLNIYQFLIGATILLCIGIIGAGGFNLRFNLVSILILVYLGMVSAIAFIVWYRLISKYHPSSITVFVFLIPIFGSIISSIMFKSESITINTLISLVMLTVGIIFVNYNKKKNETDKGKENEC